MLLASMSETTNNSTDNSTNSYECPNCQKLFKTSVPAGILSCPHCQQKILLSPLDKASNALKRLFKSEHTANAQTNDTFNKLTPKQKEMLATHVDCQTCGANFTVYQAFESCPACKDEQNHVIFKKNLELVGKQLELAQTITTELHTLLVENSLEDLVSSFDGFARRLTDKSKNKASKPDKVGYLSFQNLKKARKDVKQLFGFDLSTPLNQERWYSANDSFQKRHLLTHNLGLVDEAYIEKSKNKSVVIGERIKIDTFEINALIEDVDILALHVLTTLELSELNSNLRDDVEHSSTQ